MFRNVAHLISFRCTVSYCILLLSFFRLRQLRIFIGVRAVHSTLVSSHILFLRATVGKKIVQVHPIKTHFATPMCTGLSKPWIKYTSSYNPPTLQTTTAAHLLLNDVVAPCHHMDEHAALHAKSIGLTVVVSSLLCLFNQLHILH